MIDSYTTTDSADLPTPVDDGAPVGHPTPAGEPILAPASVSTSANSAGSTDPEQPPLFPYPPQSDHCDSAANQPVLAAVGELILAWGRLEHATAEKLASMRQAFGDVRVVGGRTRPTIQKLLAELRALVAMRDRHDKQVLTVIADIDGALQRTAQFRTLVIEGSQSCDDDAVTCRDIKNNPHRVALADLRREISQLDHIRGQIALL